MAKIRHEHPLSAYRYLEDNGRAKTYDFHLESEILQVLKGPFLWIFALSFMMGFPVIMYKFFIMENPSRGYLWYLCQFVKFENWYPGFDFMLFVLFALGMMTVIFGYLFSKLEKIIDRYSERKNRRPVRPSYIFYPEPGSPFHQINKIKNITDYGNFLVFDFGEKVKTMLFFEAEKKVFSRLTKSTFSQTHKIPYSRNYTFQLIKIFSWLYVIFLIWIFINLLAH